jgi:hypothetical protein
LEDDGTLRITGHDHGPEVAPTTPSEITATATGVLASILIFGSFRSCPATGLSY